MEVAATVEVTEEAVMAAATGAVATAEATVGVETVAARAAGKAEAATVVATVAATVGVETVAVMGGAAMEVG